MKLFLRIFIIVLFFIVSAGWIWQDSVAKKNKEAVKLYNEGKIDEALSKWRDAQIESPDKEELHYNIGNALHQERKYEDAYREYEKSLGSKDTDLQSKIYYNIGNTHYRMGKLPEAIQYYEKCLELNPDDEDAKYNIEFIKKKMQENLEKQEKQEGKEGNKTQKEQAQQQEMQESESSREEKKGEGEEEKQSAKKEGEEEQEGVEKKEQQEEGRKGEMSEEDAIRLLDALKDDEKELQRELRTQPGAGRYKVDKDW